jgi:hypothetical protein
MLRFINWYIAKLHVAATRDIALTTAFLRVANLMMPPQSLLRPAIAWRVWRGNQRPRLSVTNQDVEQVLQLVAVFFAALAAAG